EKDWRAIFKDRKVDHVVLYSPERERLGGPLLWLTLEPLNEETKDWVLLNMNSHAAVFGLRRMPGYQEREVVFAQEAYYPKPEQQAPEDGMLRLPQEQPFWAAFTDPPPSRTYQSDEAYMQLRQFQIGQDRSYRTNLRNWKALLGSFTFGSAA